MVTVNVSDANDNHPVFTIPPGGYASSLYEDSPLGSEVITVVATDRDLALHSQITYSLSDPSVPFQIHNPEVWESVKSMVLGYVLCVNRLGPSQSQLHWIERPAVSTV